MRLKPRHYLLLAVLVALGIWNVLRYHRARQAVVEGPRSGSPAWQAFDHAASLRDAPDAQFTPALESLRTQTENTTSPQGSDLRGCQMWLLYYRHSAPAASGKPGDWAILATSHVQTCVADHRDVGR